MGVKCTLLGHAYDDPEIEREREERGEEAVVTIREVKICSRCGERSIVSENKEVTAIGGPDKPGGAGAEETAGAADVLEEADPATGSEAAGPAPGAGDETAPEQAEGPEHDPETDDGVILDDETAPEPEDSEDPGEREYGEWPDAEEDHASAEADPAAAGAGEPAEWPDSEAEDEGYDAEFPDEEPADVEVPGEEGVPPEEAEDSGSADAEPADGGDASQHGEQGEGTGIDRAGEARTQRPPGTGGTELHCPACGYRDPSHDGSLREGDICPECRSGYLAARE